LSRGERAHAGSVGAGSGSARIAARRRAASSRARSAAVRLAAAAARSSRSRSRTGSCGGRYGGDHLGRQLGRQLETDRVRRCAPPVQRHRVGRLRAFRGAARVGEPAAFGLGPLLGRGGVLFGAFAVGGGLVERGERLLHDLHGGPQLAEHRPRGLDRAPVPVDRVEHGSGIGGHGQPRLVEHRRDRQRGTRAHSGQFGGVRTGRAREATQVLVQLSGVGAHPRAGLLGAASGRGRGLRGAPGGLLAFRGQRPTGGQLLFGAHQRVSVQLGEPSTDRRPLAPGLGPLPLRRLPLRDDLRQPRPAPLDLADQPGALGVGGRHLGPAGAEHLTGIVGVDPGERRNPLGAAPLPVELLAERRELVERVACRADGVIVDLRQRLDELLGEAGRLDVLPDLRLAQPVQQPQQLVVLERLEPEQRASDVLLVGPRRVEEVPAALLDRGPQPLAGERPGVVLQFQVDADAPGQGEVPGHRGTRGLRGPDADAAGEPLVGGGELHPQVPRAVLPGVAVEHEPQQAGVVASRRGHAGLVAVEDERQQHLEGLRLPGAVGAAQQQPPVGEFEDLVVVLPDVEDAGAGEPEALGHGSSSSNRDRCPSASVAETA
jgi:hypothetical protein